MAEIMKISNFSSSELQIYLNTSTMPLSTSFSEEVDNSGFNFQVI